jgi:hypothetical protein
MSAKMNDADIVFTSAEMGGIHPNPTPHRMK